MLLISLHTFLFAAFALELCFGQGKQLSAEYFELGTHPVHVFSPLQGYMTHLCCFKFLEAIPQIRCGFCLLHCQYATDPAFIDFMKYKEFLQNVVF